MTPDEIALSASSPSKMLHMGASSAAVPPGAGSWHAQQDGHGARSPAGSRAAGEAGSTPVWERAAQYKARGQRKVAVSKAAVLVAEEAETKVRPQLTAAAKHKIRTTDDLAKWAVQRKLPCPCLDLCRRPARAYRCACRMPPAALAPGVLEAGVGA